MFQIFTEWTMILEGNKKALPCIKISVKLFYKTIFEHRSCKNTISLNGLMVRFQLCRRLLRPLLLRHDRAKISRIKCKIGKGFIFLFSIHWPVTIRDKYNMVQTCSIFFFFCDRITAFSSFSCITSATTT